MTRVFVLDDHDLVRRGIVDVIDAAHDLQVVGEAASVRQTLGRVAATRPDVAVLDLHLPDGTGVDVCKAIRAAHPGTHCVILTVHDSDEARRDAAAAGAAAYLLKGITAGNLLETIRAVASGRILLKAPAPLPEEEDATKLDSLTPREKQVLGLLAEGLTNRQIGERLELAEKTIKNYVTRLLDKLGMERRTQAAVYATRQH